MIANDSTKQPQSEVETSNFEHLISATSQAAKWSVLTEVLARLISPVTQLALARLLAPEAFGIVATIVMVTTFADLIADSGFQKYLVQREFPNELTLDRYASVACWSSLSLAIVCTALISLFRDPISTLVGSPGYGAAVAVASLTIPLTVLSSTQLALLRRGFRFKQILPARLGSALIIPVVAIPLASVGVGYWSLIAGTLASELVRAIALTVGSGWLPKRFFSFAILRDMLSVSSWTFLESFSIWINAWVGVFIVSQYLAPREVGLYREPVVVVTSIFALVTASMTPILFSALARLQTQSHEFRKYFQRFQFSVAIFVIPIGVGAFFFRKVLTSILFGPQWEDAALMFGVWAMSTGFLIVLSHFYSEVFRALGKPQISFFSQSAYLVVLIPALILASAQGFNTLVVTSGAIRSVQFMMNQVLVYRFARISLRQTVINLRPPLLSVVPMSVAAWLLAPATSDSWWEF